MIRDFIEIQDHTTLDALIERLVAARDSLPNPASAEVKLKGDDVFGRRISIAFQRPQTAEEAQCDARYVNAYRESRQRELNRLQAELGVVSRTEGARPRRLRVVG
jgi:hypothetical protein